MTVNEYLMCIKKLNPDARVAIWQDSADKEPYPKWDDAHTGAKPTKEECEAVLSTVQAEVKTIADAEQARISAKTQAIATNLPSWSQVDAAVTAISSLADAKAFIRKLARVVYWLAKDSAE